MTAKTQNNATKSNATEIEKSLNIQIDAVAAKSVDHAKVLKAVLISCVAFAIDHGNYAPLNRLHQKVSASDAEGIRLFISNICRKYGKEYVDDKGNSRIALPINIKKGEGFLAGKIGENADLTELCKQGRKAIRKAINNGAIQEMPVGPMEKDRNARAERKLMDNDKMEEKIAAILSTAAKDGVSESRLSQFNRLLDIKHKVNLTAAMAAADKELAEAKAKVERLEKIVENRKAMADTEEPETPEETAENGENDLTKAA